MKTHQCKTNTLIAIRSESKKYCKLNPKNAFPILIKPHYNRSPLNIIDFNE